MSVGNATSGMPESHRTLRRNASRVAASPSSAPTDSEAAMFSSMFIKLYSSSPSSCRDDFCASAAVHRAGRSAASAPPTRSSTERRLNRRSIWMMEAAHCMCQWRSASELMLAYVSFIWAFNTGREHQLQHGALFRVGRSRAGGGPARGAP